MTKKEIIALLNKKIKIVNMCIDDTMKQNNYPSEKFFNGKKTAYEEVIALIKDK